MTEFHITQEDIMNAEDVDFEAIKEEWNEYKLSDGSKLKVKLVLIGVKRLKKYQPDGKPIYIINSTNVVRVVDVPEKLKGKPSQRFPPSGTIYR